RYVISNFTPTTIWDVSDPFNVAEQLTTQPGPGTFEFVIPTPALKEFVAHTGSFYFTPVAIGQIPNQNLHATQPVDYIIITNPLFKQQSQKLADLHFQYDTLSYVIATTDEIYNEFSSGAQDITAIRDFIRMIYKRATPSTLPKYVLLFGDGSYDNLHRYATNNTDFVPTYQSYNSISYIGSFASDDFFGFMDDTEGDFTNNDIVDVGVGRLPAHSVTEADNLVNKVIHYYKKDAGFDPYANTPTCSSGNENTFGEWRNWICFIADDANDSWETTFVHGSENFAGIVTATNKNYNIDKIYLDSYKQESTPGGERYPDANEAFNKRVEKGALIINYSGHGGETGLAHENVLDIPQILRWNNLNNLPMFLTATCEFSRYDDPARTSAGEEVLLHSAGGGIALFTTTRVAFASDGDALCPKFFNAALTPLGTKMPLLGDIIRLTKTNTGAGYRHFTLLGDPAVLLAYPKEGVVTTQVNISPAGTNDTISALEKVTVTGYVSDNSGNKLSGYNGVIFPTVFDKSVKYTTLGNDLGAAGMINFYLQKNALYKGKSLVTNGDFSFSFIVPKDISYQFGYGRISYYAQNGDIDASGYYEKIVVGGSDSTARVDAIGPEVKLFMNDNKFVYGGTTNESPKLYAEVFDSSGINTVGNGIGHDLVAILDANTNKPYVLNDYYQSDLNSFRSGKITYPFSELNEGTHTLSIKVWDIQNNSSSSTTEFVVASSSELALRHVLNYPNPFTTSTKFFIEHNQCCVGLNVEIQVFTISGKIVKTLNKNVTNEGYRTDGLDWDGKDDFGDKIGQGVYVYRVKVKTTDGKSSEKFEKLVILN
ncbi:MAG: type IX secretion system sortase PorU, partial [Bacteroidia bacterium]